MTSLTQEVTSRGSKGNRVDPVTLGKSESRG